jgi:aspartate aminotransferase
MTVGAAASLTICLNALTASPKDEFITIAPFFPEYRVFVEKAGAKLVVVPADTTSFQIDFDALEKALSPHTKGVIINSPNNPSGAVYSEETIEKLSALLREKSAAFGTEIFLITDEPYREIVYDGVTVPFVTKYYDNTLVCYSYSKSLSLPGERIGYILVPDEAAESKNVYAAVAGAGRALGYVCAPSLFQKVIVKCMGQTGDVELYRKNRNLLYEGLTKIGYECFKPEGAFYLFVKTLEPDSDAFCENAKEEDLLIVSATGFGCPGYARISYCVDEDMIRRSFAAFERLYRRYQ